MSLLKKNVLANVVGQAVSLLSSIALVPLYVHFLGDEAFGLVGLLLSIQAMAAMLDLGLSAAANREISRLTATPTTHGRDLVRTLEAVYWAMALAILLVILIASGWLSRSWIQARSLSPQTIQICLMIAAATVSLRFQESLYHGVLRGLERQVLLNAFTTVSTTCQVVASALFLAVWRPSVAAFFVFQAVLVGLEAVLLRHYAWRALGSRPSERPMVRLAYIREIWRFALSVNAITVFATGIKQIDKIVVSRLFPLENLGYYTAAWLAAAGISRLAVPFQIAIFPRFSRLIAAGAPEEIRSLFHRSVQLVSVVTCSAAGGVLFFARELVTVWTQSPDVASHVWAPLAVLAAGTMLNGMMAPAFSLVLAAGVTGISLYMNAFGFIILVPVTFLLAKAFGLVGAAVAWLAFNCVYYALVPPILAKRVPIFGLSRFYLNDTLPYAVFAIGIFGAAHVATRGLGVYSTLAIATVAGVAYLAVAIRLSPALFSMMRDSVRLLRQQTL